VRHRAPRPRSAVLALRIGAGVLAAAALGGLSLAMLAPAAASAQSAAAYVALGDSYSSGVGAGSHIGSSRSCDQSANAYPALRDAASQPASYTSEACSGATTATVLGSQLGALSPATTLVSITVGGNDVGFSSVMETCVLLPTISTARFRRPRRGTAMCSPTCAGPSGATRSATPAAGSTRLTSWTSASLTTPRRPGSPAPTCPYSAATRADHAPAPAGVCTPAGAGYADHHVGNGGVRATSPAPGVRVGASPARRASAANSAEFTTAAPPGSLLK
jgi:GDSL-like Lipase/Acylhydrolase family